MNYQRTTHEYHHCFIKEYSYEPQEQFLFTVACLYSYAIDVPRSHHNLLQDSVSSTKLFCTDTFQTTLDILGLSNRWRIALSFRSIQSPSKACEVCSSVIVYQIRFQFWCSFLLLLYYVHRFSWLIFFFLQQESLQSTTLFVKHLKQFIRTIYHLVGTQAQTQACAILLLHSPAEYIRQIWQPLMPFRKIHHCPAQQ